MQKSTPLFLCLLALLGVYVRIAVGPGFERTNEALVAEQEIAGQSVVIADVTGVD